jgi:ubiquinone/menaquinone biosynthesis C-methylase UbiE
MRVVDLDRDMSDVIPTAISRDAEFLFRRMEDETIAALRGGPGRRILDQAGGLGQDSRRVAREGAWTVCAEPSRRMTQLGRILEAKEAERSGPPAHPVRWTRAWADALPFRDASFDASFCKGALDHFDEPLGCIGEMARVTRDDGRVVLAVANFSSLGCRVQRWLDHIGTRPPAGRRPYHVPSDHFTRYDPKLLSEQVSRYVEIEEWVGVSLLWGVRPWGRFLAMIGPVASDVLLRGLDRIARWIPSLADVIVVAGRPRR